MTITLEDTVSADDDQQRNITLQWHFPKDKTLTIEDSQVVVTSPTGNRLTIEFEGEIPDNLSVAKGRKEDRVFSCISYKANQVEPSQVLRVVFKERRGLNVTTRFRFAMAEDRVAPAPEKADIPEHTLATLLAASRQDEPVTHSVMIGNASAYLALAKSHREQGLGHVSLLVNDSAACEQAQAQLREHYLTTWLSCRPLALASAPPITADKAALKGLEGIGRLVITPTGFTEKRLTTVLLTMLPPLLKRMSKTGEVWISADLPYSLQALCTTWAEQRGLAVSVVTGLDAAMEMSHD